MTAINDYLEICFSLVRCLSKQELKDVETTIKPLVEMAHKMTDLKLTIHEFSEFITTQIQSLCVWGSLKINLRRISVGIRSDLKWIEQRSNHLYASSFLSYVLTALTSSRLNDIIEYGQRFLEVYKLEIWDGVLPSEHSQVAITVAVAAVLHLLAFVFQYLIGYTDRGGSKTYSSGCLDFRESFISLLLFHGAYVWIKFRQSATGKRKAVSTQSGVNRSKVYARASKNGSATKYEARYNIPTDRLDEDHPVECPRLSLGSYKSDVEALFVSRVPRTYYEVDQGEAACCVEVQGVQHKFSVPAMSEQEQALVGEEKRQWVISKAKQVGKQKYAEFRKEQLATATDTGSSDPSPSPLTCQPSDGFTDEDFEAMHCAELGFHSAPQHRTTLDISSPYSDFEKVSLPHFDTEAVEHPQIWSVQNFQQLRSWDAGDAAVPYADGTRSEPIGVEQSRDLSSVEQRFEQQWPWESPPVVSTLTESEDFEAMWAVLDLCPAPQQESTLDRNIPYSGSASIESVPQESVLSQEHYSWDAEHPQVPEPQQVHRPLQQIEVSKENDCVHQRYEGLLKDYERLREENELLRSVIVTLVAGKILDDDAQ